MFITNQETQAACTYSRKDFNLYPIFSNICACLEVLTSGAFAACDSTLMEHAEIKHFIFSVIF